MKEKNCYSRLLDKTRIPTEQEFYDLCGQTKDLLSDCDCFLMEFTGMTKSLRFPYGNSYGWAYKYAHKNKLVCDIFAELGAFTVMIRLSNQQIKSVYELVRAQTQNCIDNKYSCGDGGWLHYRVLNQADLVDIKKIIQAKLTVSK